MKKILIVANALNADGGIGNSLLNMIEAMEQLQDIFNMDLLLLEPESGHLLKERYSNIHIIPIEYSIDINVSSYLLLKEALKGRSPYSRLKILVARFLFKWAYQIPLMNTSAELIKKIDCEYDIAIAYNVIPSYIASFVAKYVSAKKKIAWSHTDISQDVFRLIPRTTSEIKGLSSYKNIIREYDEIVAVSDGVKQSIQNEITGKNQKIKVIHNIVDKDKIIEKAQESCDFNFDEDTITLLTVGRISVEKGIDLALDVMRMLKASGYRFKWIFLGENLEKRRVHEYVEKFNLHTNFFDLGVITNPYPYFRLSDIYVHTSLIEGYCTVTNEARMLGKPIVTTDVAGAAEQIKNGENGFVVEKSAIAVFKAVKKIIDNDKLREKFELFNQRLSFDNTEQIIQIKELLKV